jgi:hypothetical protein
MSKIATKRITGFQHLTSSLTSSSKIPTLSRSTANRLDLSNEILYTVGTIKHHTMRNTDLTQHCTEELELWKDNDQYLYREWNKTIRTGNISYIKDAFDEMGFKYTKEQWDHLVDAFEEELAENERALEERNAKEDAAYLIKRTFA